MPLDRNMNDDPPTHAGGVVFRRKGGEVEYLLVQAKRAREQWVLPKGHIDPGEAMEETAAREVREETGVTARIKSELPRISLSVKGKNICIQFYLMEAIEEGKPAEEREHQWLPLDAAIRVASHKESRDLLKLAEQNRTG